MNPHTSPLAGKSRKVLSFVMLVTLVVVAFFSGNAVGSQNSTIVIADRTANAFTGIDGGELEKRADFSTFWRAYNVLEEKFVATHGTTSSSDTSRVTGGRRRC